MLTVLCQPNCHHLQPMSNCRQSATKYTSRLGPLVLVVVNNLHHNGWLDQNIQQRLEAAEEIQVRVSIKYHYQVKVEGGVRLHHRARTLT